MRTAKLFNPLTRKKFRNEQATNIQRVFRGMRGRRHADQRRQFLQQKADARTLKKHDGMARRIQRVWHGYLTRRWCVACTWQRVVVRRGQTEETTDLCST